MSSCNYGTDIWFKKRSVNGLRRSVTSVSRKKTQRRIRLDCIYCIILQVYKDLEANFVDHFNVGVISASHFPRCRQFLLCFVRRT